MHHYLGIFIESVLLFGIVLTIKEEEDEIILRFCKEAKFEDDINRLIYKEYKILKTAFCILNDECVSDFLFKYFEDFKKFYNNVCLQENLKEV